MSKNEVTDGINFSNLASTMTEVQARTISPSTVTAHAEGPVLIVFGNEKGGSGKSTSALQTAIALMYRGFRVGTIDLDARQGTMTRYLRNRYLYASQQKTRLPCPLHLPIDRSHAETMTEQKSEDMGFMAMAMDELGSVCDFIIVDTPGADTHLNRLAHGLADILVTPMNDSLIDLDVLASIDPLTFDVRAPSFYTQHVHKLLGEKERQLGRKTDWIVMRNRLSSLDNQNKRRIQDILGTLAGSYGFRLTNGFGERLIYRDLFLQGLTIMDLARMENAAPFTPSQQGAMTEIHALMDVLAPERYKNPATERVM
jgi:chromosome partitioning protein